jgi:hypothetical protein
VPFFIPRIKSYTLGLLLKNGHLNLAKSGHYSLAATVALRIIGVYVNSLIFPVPKSAKIKQELSGLRFICIFEAHLSWN